MMRVALASLLLVMLAASPMASASEPDATAEAHDLADVALLASEGHRFAEAARLLDRAFDRAPHPLYRLAAGEAYLHDGDTEHADARLADALADPTLPPVARQRTEALLARTRAAAVHVARARADRPAEAARAWEDAFDAAEVGRFLVQAGLSWEAARSFERAAADFARAAQRDDLPPDAAVAAASGLVRARAAMPPEPPDRTVPWVATGAAAAALAFGGAALLASNRYHADVRSGLAHQQNGVVTGITRAEAQRREALAGDWRTAAWIGLDVGAGLLATGLVLFATTPDTASHVRVIQHQARRFMRPTTLHPLAAAGCLFVLASRESSE